MPWEVIVQKKLSAWKHIAEKLLVYPIVKGLHQAFGLRRVIWNAEFFIFSFPAEKR